MLSDLWRYASRIAIMVGALLTLLVVAELVDLFLSIHTVNPTLAWIFAVLLVALAGSGLGSIIWSIYTKPPVLAPPPRHSDPLAPRNLRNHVLYLARYLRNLSQNPSLDDSARVRAAEEAHLLRSTVRAGPRAILDQVLKTEEQTIKPLLATLRQKAHGEVTRCVRDVMLGVTLSPYRGGDILIVLYRNGAMIVRVTAIYAGRPRIREQMLVFSDTIAVVAAVNLLNLSGRLLEGLTARIPFIGSYADDIAQGVGAGFLTSAAGHALMDRCEAFHGWGREEAVASLGRQSAVFMSDVRDIFFRDVVPDLRSRIRPTESEPDEAKFWLRVSDGIRASIDATAEQLQGYVVRPARVGGRAVAKSGSSIGGAVAQVTSATIKAAHNSVRAAARAGAVANGKIVAGALRASHWVRRRATHRATRPTDEDQLPRPNKDVPKSDEVQE